MAGYSARQSSFTTGDTILAAHSNDEFNQVLAAFHATTGHSHDGTAGEGGPVGVIRDADSLNKILVDTSNNHLEFYVEVSSAAVQQLRIQDGAIVPITDSDIDLGTSSLEFKDLFIDGTANIDALVADTADINAGTVDGATLGTNSAITQAVIDNINIDGATIGHTSDTDLLTLASGILTVAGEVSMTTLDIGGTNVTSTAAELNLVDGITAGTVSASLAVIADSNKDISGFRNVTLTGELDAGSLDISGDADIDGTLEADAITVNGATLTEFITDAVGGMVSSNTETGITVTFEDSDNTLDFALGSSQTTISSLLNTSLVVGRDSDNDIDFATDNTILFRADGADQIKLVNGALAPVTNNDIDLGTSSLEFKDAFFDGTVTADAFAGPLTGNVTGNVSGTAATVTGAAQSNITSLGTLTTLTVDNVIINGTTIGHTSDTDLITLADGVATVAGEISVTTLDIGGTNVSATATELNLIDGGATIGTDAIADGDGIIHNDGGTMKVTSAATFKTYFTSGVSSAADDLTAGDAAVNLTTSSGNITIDAAANDSDVIFKGTDNSSDITMLTLDGSDAGSATFNDKVIVGDGKLVLNSTAVTSTAAELNLLDGVSGLVQADLTKLAAVDSTAAELNIVDGGTSATSTTVADADRVVLNDNGTMVQVAVTDLAAYFDDEITAMPNLVTTAATTVGALNSGSITSGFGTIDTGSSTITTTGLISGGSLDIDNVLINGTTIGHTDDTDLLTVANGLLTIAGEISVTTLDIGGTNVTSTAAELNILDGVTSTAAELNILDGVTSTAAEINIIDGNTSATSTTLVDADRVVVNDNGTMVQVAMTDVKTYIGGGTSWQAVKTSNYTASAGQGVFANTTSSAFTVTLPASPSLGDEVTIVDYAGTFDSNALTVGRNSSKIFGADEDLVVLS